jgi:uncharacterized repeat protein (TIGR03803 family)
VTLDAAGNLYGTTSRGGAFCPNLGGCGVVFKLAHNTDGTWTESVLWSFEGPHFPLGGVVFDKAGNLYGTTYNGGDPSCEPPNGCGLVFKLAPNHDGIWNLTPIQVTIQKLTLGIQVNGMGMLREPHDGTFSQSHATFYAAPHQVLTGTSELRGDALRSTGTG